MPGLWVQAKQRVRKQAVLSAKLERHTRAYKCTSFTEKLLISRNWRSKGLRGIRSLRNSMSIENVWTHSENCS